MIIEIDDFVIETGRPKIRKVGPENKSYCGRVMIFIPFTSRNIGFAKRRLKKEYYSFLCNGRTTQSLSEYGFPDSLANTYISSGEEATGYIRVPYSGQALYKVKFKHKFCKKGSNNCIYLHFEGERKKQPIPPKKNVNNITKKKTTKIKNLHHSSDYSVLKKVNGIKTIKRRHGTDSSKKWNTIELQRLLQDLDKLNELKNSDPNTFDRGAMK